MNIIVPGIPKRLQITPMMVDDFLWDPCLGVQFFMGIKLDVFQRVRLKTFWHIPFGIDSSGFTSGKTITDFAYVSLRCLLIPEHAAGVYYPVFDTGKRTFWKYFSRISNPMFRAHLGRLDETGEEDGKAKSRESACYKAYFRDGSVIEMPAPSFMKNSITQASLRYNTLLIEEWTHIDAMSDGIDDQLMGRLTAPSFGNQHHPLWTNHLKMTAPAKTQLHPAYARVKTFELDIRKGNPAYFHIHFCYKDYSPGFTDAGGKPVRMELAIENKKKQTTPAEFVGEGLGIWGKNTKGWYTETDLLRCVELGTMSKLRPVSSRAEDEAVRLKFEVLPPGGPEMERMRRVGAAPFTAETFYFCGVDPAPAQAAKNDDGAIAVLRVRPLILPESGWSDNPGDYDISLVYLRVLRNADTGEWAGLLHGLHRAFGLSKMLMDWGAAGGGPLIKKELAKSRQMIQHSEVECSPIVTAEDAGLVRAAYILHVYKRKDSGLERLFGTLAGDDNLADMSHVEMREAVRKAFIKFPKMYQEWTPEEKANLGEENLWSLRHMTDPSTTTGSAIEQFANIGVAMKKDAQLILEDGRLNEDGQQYELTKNGARQFAAVKGRKDKQTAIMMSYLAFLIWLRTEAGYARQKPEDAGMCWAS